MSVRSLRSSIPEFVDRVVSKRISPAGGSVSDRRGLLAGALALFVFTTAIAWWNLPESDTNVRWWLLALLVVAGTPANLAATSYELVVMGRLLGYRIPVRESLHVSVLSSAANLLPLPGSVLVRAVVLRERGASYRAIGMSVVSMALGLLSMTGLLCGAILLVAGVYFLGIILLVGGTSSAIVLWTLTRGRGSSRPWLAMLDVLGSQAFLIVVISARLFVALPALGYAASLSQTAALAAASVAATATGVFPAGLGIRELASGIAGRFVELPVSVGVVAAAADRVVFGIGLLPIGVALMWRPSARQK